jgi:ribose transport system permease protein
MTANNGAVEVPENNLRRENTIMFLREYAVLILLAALFITLSVASDSFLSVSNILNILNQQAPLAIVAVAGTLVIISGGFDLSTGAIFAISNVMAAWIAVNLDNVWLGLAFAPVIGLFLGAINGTLITKLHIHSFLATLASSLAFRAVAVLVTGGALISVADPKFAIIGRDRFMGVFWSIYILIAFVLFIAFVLNRTKFGRYVFAVGGNEEAAVMSGISVDRIRIAVFALSGLAAGVASAIAVSRVASGQPLAGTGLELQAIAAIILGGTSIYGGMGAIWRSLGGVYLIALIGNGFNLLNLNPLFKDLVTGIIILSAVALSATERRKH